MGAGVSAFALTIVAGLLWAVVIVVRVVRTGALRPWGGQLPAGDEVAGFRRAWDRLTLFRFASGPVLLLGLGFTPVGSALVRLLSPSSVDAAGVIIGALTGVAFAFRADILNRLRRAVGSMPGARTAPRQRLRQAAILAAAGAGYGYLVADAQSPVTYTATLSTGFFDPGGSGPTFGDALYGSYAPRVIIDGTTVTTVILVVIGALAFSDRLLFQPAGPADDQLTGCTAYVAGLFALQPPKVVLSRRTSVGLAAVSPGWRPVIAFRAETRQSLPSDQLTWVTAHEMAHIAHRHGYLRVASGFARLLTGVFFVALLSDGDRLMSLAGIGQPDLDSLISFTPDLEKLPLQVAILTLWLLLTRPVELFASRREEAFADQEAERVVPGYGVLSLDAVARLTPQPQQTFWRDRLLWLSHPSLVERRSRLAQRHPDPA